jgi:hypothetical protein
LPNQHTQDSKPVAEPQKTANVHAGIGIRGELLNLVIVLGFCCTVLLGNTQGEMICKDGKERLRHRQGPSNLPIHNLSCFKKHVKKLPKAFNFLQQRRYKLFSLIGSIY